jgi:hypothetical protein
MGASTNEPAVVWLDQERFDEYTAELEYLRGVHRPQLIQRIRDARDEGGLAGGAKYDVARAQLGKLDGRIAWLRNKLLNGQVGDPPADGPDVGPAGRRRARLSILVDWVRLGAHSRSSCVEDVAPAVPRTCVYCGDEFGESDVCLVVTDDYGADRLLHASCSPRLAAAISEQSEAMKTRAARIGATYRGTPSGRDESNFRKL